MNQQKRIKILFLLKKKYGLKKKTDLIFSSPFECLISVVLSAQARDTVVNRITKNLFSIANNPVKMLSLGEKGIKNIIRKIGLFRKKSKNIYKICKILLEKYNSIVPNNRRELELLPGVGRKTSNVVLNIIFKKKKIAVDTHVYRVCQRTAFACGKNVIEVERLLLKYVPEKFKIYVHHWFIFHGKNTCKARNMKCNNCIINKFCEYYQYLAKEKFLKIF
ncbi:endonuclease III [Buchnera aphidicola]|uniref:endonuclease III n=1 Tax=Buchnera aphidicola TaxID=9 RepID=UPI002093CF41|nr:endonuclease III [Buchnera aphidicola]USS94215.1 endonuclease III [Buchnera aphidicola (Sipha maydis)]WII23763.1 endonuclease III [Buchnera aphidicola (Sipha maydis)]